MTTWEEPLRLDLTFADGGHGDTVVDGPLLGEPLQECIEGSTFQAQHDVSLQTGRKLQRPIRSLAALALDLTGFECTSGSRIQSLALQPARSCATMSSDTGDLAEECGAAVVLGWRWNHTSTALNDRRSGRLSAHYSIQSLGEVKEVLTLQSFCGSTFGRLDQHAFDSESSVDPLRAQALAHGLGRVRRGVTIDASESGLAEHENFQGRDTVANLNDRRDGAQHRETNWNIPSTDRHPNLLWVREVTRHHHRRWHDRGDPRLQGRKAPPSQCRSRKIANVYYSPVESKNNSAPMTLESALASVEISCDKQRGPTRMRRLVDARREAIRSEGDSLGDEGNLICLHQIIDAPTLGSTFA